MKALDEEKAALARDRIIFATNRESERNHEEIERNSERRRLEIERLALEKAREQVQSHCSILMYFSLSAVMYFLSISINVTLWYIQVSCSL